MMIRILIVEDDTDINQLLAKMMKQAGYQTIQAFSGTEALLLAQQEMVDLVLLDLMLPGISGEEVLNQFRQVYQLTCPILILSAKSFLSDKVYLFSLGADDYITKPFEPMEVLARVQANLRRGQVNITKTVLEYKRLTLYPDSRQLLVDNKEVILTAHEFDILQLLMSQPDKVFSREQLYQVVWKDGYYGENNTVNVHISNIRKKLKEQLPDEVIQTIYGIGFKLV